MNIFYSDYHVAQNASLVIYERGCHQAGKEFVETNLVPVATIFVAASLLTLNVFYFDYHVAQNVNASLVIYERGYLQSGKEWVESNLVPLATIFVAAFLISLNLF